MPRSISSRCSQTLSPILLFVRPFWRMVRITILFFNTKRTDSSGSLYTGSSRKKFAISEYIRFTPSLSSLTQPNSVRTREIRGFLEYRVFLMFCSVTTFGNFPGLSISRRSSYMLTLMKLPLIPYSRCVTALTTPSNQANSGYSGTI